jgi:uncharacterized protein YbbK (DUF523 family)
MTRPEHLRERPVLVSACLLGRACRYDGAHCAQGELAEKLSQYGEVAVPFCPEEEGGLPTPRPPAWIESRGAAEVIDGEDRVVDIEGKEVTDFFLRGARAALALCRERGIAKAYLKERSPSCGVHSTHIAEVLVDGPGVAAELLARHGIDIVGV